MDNPVQPFCPHLGLKNDPTTSFSYPSKGNICYHARRRPTPELEYQRITCLTLQHINCPVYKSPPGVSLPKNIRQPRKAFTITPKTVLWVLLLIVLAAGIILGINYREQLRNQASRLLVPAWQQTQQALPATLTPTLELLPTETQTTTVTPTVTNTPEPTPSPTRTIRPPVMNLDTPIGGEVKFIIHRVQEGEAIGQYASQYNTTEAAIRAVNYNMPSVLFIDWLVVIPLGVTDASGLPAFQPIQMETGGLSVEMFARQLGVDLEKINLYNDFDPGRILQPGEWILIPRE